MMSLSKKRKLSPDDISDSAHDAIRKRLRDRSQLATPTKRPSYQTEEETSPEQSPLTRRKRTNKRLATTKSSKKGDYSIFRVREILREEGNKFLLAWDGTDPTTGKPYEPSWEPRHHLADDLLEDWERSKAEAKRTNPFSPNSKASTTTIPRKPNTVESSVDNSPSAGQEKETHTAPHTEEASPETYTTKDTDPHINGNGTGPPPIVRISRPVDFNSQDYDRFTSRSCSQQTILSNGSTDDKLAGPVILDSQAKSSAFLRLHLGRVTPRSSSNSPDSDYESSPLRSALSQIDQIEDGSSPEKQAVDDLARSTASEDSNDVSEPSLALPHSSVIAISPGAHDTPRSVELEIAGSALTEPNPSEAKDEPPAAIDLGANESILSDEDSITTPRQNSQLFEFGPSLVPSYTSYHQAGQIEEGSTDLESDPNNNNLDAVVKPICDPSVESTLNSTITNRIYSDKPPSEQGPPVNGNLPSSRDTGHIVSDVLAEQPREQKAVETDSSVGIDHSPLITQVSTREDIQPKDSTNHSEDPSSAIEFLRPETQNIAEPLSTPDQTLKVADGEASLSNTNNNIPIIVPSSIRESVKRKLKDRYPPPSPLEIEYQAGPDRGPTLIQTYGLRIPPRPQTPADMSGSLPLGSSPGSDPKIEETRAYLSQLIDNAGIKRRKDKIAQPQSSASGGEQSTPSPLDAAVSPIESSTNHVGVSDTAPAGASQAIIEESSIPTGSRQSVSETLNAAIQKSDSTQSTSAGITGSSDVKMENVETNTKTTSVGRDNDFIVPLPLIGPASTSTYAAHFKEKEHSIEKFLAQSNWDEDSPMVLEMQGMIEELNKIITHTDLCASEALTQEGVSDKDQAAWSASTSSKFKFLKFFCSMGQRAKQRLRISIFGRPGATLDLLETFLKGIKVKYQRPDQAQNSLDIEDELLVTLLSTKDQGSKYVGERQDLIVGFDDSFDINDPQMTYVRTHLVDSGLMVPAITLVITNSVEHVQRMLPGGIGKIEKLQMLVAHATKLRRFACHAKTDAPVAEQDGGLVATFLLLGGDVNQWPLSPLPKIEFSDSNPGEQTPGIVQRPSAPKRPLTETSLDAADHSSKKRRASPAPSNAPDSSAVEVSHVSDTVIAPSADVAVLSNSHQAAEDSKQPEESQKLPRGDDTLSHRVSNLQNSLNDHVNALQAIQSRYESSEKENRGLKVDIAEAKKALTTVETQKASLSATVTNLQGQNATIRTDLTNARALLAGSTQPSLADLEAGRASAREVESLTKRLDNLKKDFEFTRQEYQRASSAAADSASEIANLNDELAVLKRQASDESTKLRQLFQDTSIRTAHAAVAKARAEAAALDRLARRQADELRGYKARDAAKMTTRAVSIGPVAAAGRAGASAAPSRGPSRLGVGGGGGGGNGRTGSGAGSRQGSRQSSPMPAASVNSTAAAGVAGGIAPAPVGAGAKAAAHHALGSSHLRQ